MKIQKAAEAIRVPENILAAKRFLGRGAATIAEFAVFYKPHQSEVCGDEAAA